MPKLTNKDIVASQLKNGMTVMIGGFMANGAPETLIDAILENNIHDLTLISTDTGMPKSGSGRLISAKRIKKLYASHIGLNPETGRQMNDGELEVVLVPQGSLAERIRAAGAGLGGVLTPTGLGTIVAEGKTIIDVDGTPYLLEKPLKADVALIRGSIIDKSGNVFYKKTTQNFNPLMATAADVVIAEAESIVDIGHIQAESVHTPSIFVDHIVQGESHV